MDGVILHPARPRWEDGLPRDPVTGDVYFSHRDPLGERRHTFLGHGGLDALLDRLRTPVVGEIGWGSGVSCLLTLARFLERDGAGPLHYVAFEHRPWQVGDLERLWSRWPALGVVARALLAAYPPPLAGFHRRELFGGRVRMIWAWGEAGEMLDRWPPGSGVDLWYLDGFSPRHDPQSWRDELLHAIAARSAPGARLVTYSAAGKVRRALEAAGFVVRKVPGHAGKRESLVAELISPPSRSRPITQPWFIRPPAEAAHEALVVGAGVAGAWSAHLLARSGWTVQVVEAASRPAMGASGNPRGLIMPRPLSPRAGVHDRLPFTAVAEALSAYASLGWRGSGLLLCWAGRAARETLGLGSWVDKAAASRLAGVPLAGAHIHWPLGGDLDPRRWIDALLETVPLRVAWRSPVGRLERIDGGWLVRGVDGRPLAAAPVVVLACAHAARRLVPHLPLDRVRGQLALLPADSRSAALRLPLCGRAGYLTPAHGGWHVLGASFEPGRHETRLDGEVHARLLAVWPRLMPGAGRPGAGLRGRVAMRAVTPDRLPLVGPVHDAAGYRRTYGDLHRGRDPRRYPAGRYLPGLYVLSGLGAHGLSLAPWGAATLVEILNGWPAGVSAMDLAAVHPARFLIRALRRGADLQSTIPAPMEESGACEGPLR